LEKQCGLSKASRSEGRIFAQHHEVFLFWRELILSKKLVPPFEIVHIDAHSDMGTNNWGWFYLLGELLHLPLKQRIYPIIDPHFGLSQGNFLAFAIACRWASKVTIVLHPKQEYSLPPIFLKDFNLKSGYIQLKKYTKADLHRLREQKELNPLEVHPLELEPAVPFECIRHFEFHSADPYGYVTLSTSPAFTPKTADRLIPIIKAYIHEI
jgi:hypothetical protein